MDSDQNPIGETVTRHVDRISTLPDDVIINSILSLLTTKDSVRTSALSTRWKHLYASVPVLDFEYDFPFEGNSDLVSKVLLNTITNNLPSVYRFRNAFHRSDIISWFETSISHSVQKLDVHGFCFEGGVTPYCLFTCETLVSLRLNLNFVLSVPNKVCLPKLKELFLKNMILCDNESVRRLLSGSLVLEKFVVLSGPMPNVRVFDVSVPSLKVLSIFLFDTRVRLIINCPNLERLRCDCYDYSGDVIGSLKECDIYIKLSKEQLQEGKLIELVRRVCKVSRLSLSCDSMEALLVPACMFPTFENLTHLRLSSTASEGWRLLPSILASSPRLNTLVFEYRLFEISGNIQPFPPPEHVPVCLSSHLKVVRFHTFRGKEDEYKLVEYFLANSLVLEKMEIHPQLSKGAKEESDPNVEGEGEGEGDGKTDSDSEGNYKISKRLLSFRRLSEVCQIVLVSPNN